MFWCKQSDTAIWMKEADDLQHTRKLSFFLFFLFKSCAALLEGVQASRVGKPMVL